MQLADVANGLFAGLISGGVGLAELLTRYRDEPGRLLRTAPALLYVLVNVAAGVLAYALLVAFGVTLGDDQEATRRVLLAGFGAVVFLRTTVFVARVGDEDVNYGPSQFVTTLLSIADTQVDRNQAHRRAEVIADVMQGVTFEKAVRALPAYCLSTLQGVAAEQQEKLAADLASLTETEMGDAQKALILGVKLLELAGERVLRASVTALGDTIR